MHAFLRCTAHSQARLPRTALPSGTLALPTLRHACLARHCPLSDTLASHGITHTQARLPRTALPTLRHACLARHCPLSGTLASHGIAHSQARLPCTALPTLRHACLAWHCPHSGMLALHGIAHTQARLPRTALPTLRHACLAWHCPHSGMLALHPHSGTLASHGIAHTMARLPRTALPTLRQALITPTAKVLAHDRVYTIPAPFCRSYIIQHSGSSRGAASVYSDSRSSVHRSRVAGLSGASPSRWWGHIGHTQPITGSHWSLQPSRVTVDKGARRFWT